MGADKLTFHFMSTFSFYLTFVTRAYQECETVYPLSVHCEKTGPVMRFWGRLGRDSEPTGLGDLGAKASKALQTRPLWAADREIRLLS